MTRFVLRLALTASICGLAAAPAVFGQAPDSVSFQGYLTNPAGDPITQAGVNMTFKLYKNSTAVWTESQSVDIVGGVFHVLLGKTSALDTMAFNVPIELGITVGGDPEISPRTPLAAAPYAKALPGLYTQFREDGADRSYNVIGGDPINVVGSGVTGATISGGGGSGLGTPTPNQVLGDYGTVGGGRGNVAEGRLSTVGGGFGNSASDFYSTVAGGYQGIASGPNAAVGGGKDNVASAELATVAGGLENVASSASSFVGGGSQNSASGQYSSIVGGTRNSVTGYWSTIAGGYENEVTDDYAAVAGGRESAARAELSFAAGWKAIAKHLGTFVWADRSTFGAGGNDSLVSTGANQFLIRAVGGVGIGTNSPQGLLHVSSGTSGDAELYLEADTDNNEEGDNPIVRLRQDGSLNGVNIGFDAGGFGSDAFGIGRRANSVDYSDTFVIKVQSGNIGIGTNDPGNHRLRVESNGTSSSASTLEAKNTSTGDGVAARFEANGTDAAVVTTHNGTGDIIKAFVSGNTRFRVHNNGDVTADGAFTGGGADLAESFDVAGDHAAYSPGDVMVISTSTNRTVEKSRIPYSTLIAGVYATKPGVLLSDLGMNADLSKRIPMAVVGVVPTKVTAENGPIRRGDMLVSSSTPGHAMAANQEHLRIGTVIGKALENFDGRGEGLIEVLVSMK